VEGKPFGRYRLIELLGRGGMGEVWRAFDTVTERVVAMKVLPSHLADDKVFQQRFRREAKAAAGLNEPHVVPIHDFGEIDGRLYVTMRLIDGQDLQTLLEAGPLEPARAVGIVEQIASALHAAHRIGLVHRDVKPSNILVTEDDFAYLIDFGIAQASEDTRITATGATVGTWGYMAPERFRTGQIDARSDVYALACVLYECLTGTGPYSGDSFEQLAAGHMFTPPPRPSALRDGVPPTFDDVIAAGMAKDPDQRYATSVELARAAREAATVPIPRSGPHPAQTPVTPTPEPRATPARATQHGARPPGAFIHAEPTQQQPPETIPPTRQQPPAAPPTPPTVPRRPWWRRKGVLVSVGVIFVVAVIAGAVGWVTVGKQRPASQAQGSQPFSPVVAQVKPSVVKISGAANSCGKKPEGSGFVVSPNRVMSNAHVVAGADSVTVESNGTTYDAQVVSYDPNADISILDVPNLSAPPLKFAEGEGKSGTDALVLGYPGGGPFVATPARIRDVIQLNGPDIYRKTTVKREVYTIRGTVRQGDSGGPLIDLDGNVLGVVFGAPVDDPDTGFVLTATEVSRQMAMVDSTQPVATGPCIQ
jgi:serine/threonine protein kinase